MHWRQRVYLLTFMVAVASTVPACLAFNVDTTDPDKYDGEPADFFGYKVQSSNDKGIVITAPLRLNGSGGIYKTGQDKWFSPTEDFETDTAAVKHLGLSIAADSSGSRFTACSPSFVHECNENSYLNSICYELSDQLQEISSFKPSFQECTKKTVDLVFLFDGSNSMTQTEFNKNKDFIVEIMNSLKNTSIKFAAVQFSSTVNKVFDFNDYEDGSALEKLRSEKHLRSLTNTHRALEFVLTEILENQAAGASPDATKVLVLITDGDPSDTNRNKIVEKYDEKNIIRLVIGIKDARLDKFRAIASEPKDKNAFKIENYDGLTGVLENFQKKIFVMEGSKVARAGDMTDEMSQSGFSTVFNKDTLILGSVGSNSWRGSLRERRGQTETQIEDQEMQMDSYMGYSVSVGERKNISLYFTGAPRFKHTGQVVLFKYNGKNWTPEQRLNGEQIGSYFGAELCSVDVNSDGDTDFLLVGAPMFYWSQEKKEGQIYIYTLTDELQLQSELNVTAPSTGRFGTTISSLADLNGDGLRDVAVGAPLEDDNSGAVYIYLGDRTRGIRSTFSQRITGKKITPGKSFFGQAIDGGFDLGQDGLPDIVIGSRGTAVTLRSKPVFNVAAHLAFQPKVISTEQLDCLGANANLPMVNLTACFEMVEATKKKQGATSSGLKITYKLTVDPMRQIYRGFFSPTDTKARSRTNTYKLTDKTTCFNFSIYMPKCIKDTLSPISIKLNFSQAESETADAILNVDSKKQSAVEVPFEKQCRKNDTCIAELEVDFNFMTLTLLVTEDNYFNVSIKLRNRGDDSYNTSLTMHYPPGLSFSRMTLVTASRSTTHNCLDLEGVRNKTICGVSLPVYRSRSSATFISSFHVMHNYEWNDKMSMTIAAKSDNQDSNRTSTQTKNISVQFEIKMILTVTDSTTYLNFTTEEPAPKHVNITYRIDNTGFKDFPVNVTLVFPTKLENNFEVKSYEVITKQNKTECTATTDHKSKDCLAENKCIKMICDTFNLEKRSAAEFKLSAKVHFRDLNQQEANLPFLKKYTGDSGKVSFVSSIKVDYDKDRYVLESHTQKNKNGFTKVQFPERKTEVRVDFIIPPNKLLIISTGVVVGLLLLIIITVILFKLGCFKRKKFGQEEENLQDDAAAVPFPAPAKSGQTSEDSQNPEEKSHLLSSAPTNGQIEQSETDKKSEKPSEENASE